MDRTINACSSLRGEIMPPGDKSISHRAMILNSIAEGKAKIDNLSLLLQSALVAEEKVGIMLNVAQENLDKVLELIPALKGPTVSSLTTEGWVAINTIVDEKVVRDLIPELRRVGAQGIVEYPLNKIVV